MVRLLVLNPSNRAIYKEYIMSFPSDLEIARKGVAKPLTEIAAMMGIGEHLLEPYIWHGYSG